MNTKSPEPQQIVLFLDLATDNPLPEDEVLEQLPQSANRKVLRVSSFGAQPTTRGQQWTQWRGWARAVDAMIAEAQAGHSPGRTPQYYVAGRASLPLFAYLGLRRGKQGTLTVLNQRDTGQWDFISTEPGEQPGGQPYFREPRVIPGDTPEGQVAVFISTGYVAPEDAIVGYLERHGEKRAATIVLETEPGARWLGADTARGAAGQVRELLADLRRYVPKARGAALFLAGPAPLAVMAGRSLNPHMFRPIWIPAFEANTYRDAIQWPPGAVHGGLLRVLLLTAGPANMAPMHLAEEEKEVRRHIQAGVARGGRVKLEVIRSAMQDDVLSSMNEHRPHVLHIAAHGNKDGDLWLADGIGDGARVSLDGFLAAVKAAGKHLQMIVLNACYSAVTADAVLKHVDYAIGIRTAVADKSALAFCEAFYAALSHGKSLLEAHEQGLAQLKIKGLPNSEDIQLLVRPGCEAGDWIPLPGAAPADD